MKHYKIVKSIVIGNVFVIIGITLLLWIANNYTHYPLLNAIWTKLEVFIEPFGIIALCLFVALRLSPRLRKKLLISKEELSITGLVPVDRKTKESRNDNHDST